MPPLADDPTCEYAGSMLNPSNDKLVIAISSRALFNLDDSHLVYEKEGLQAYSKYQVAREEEPLEAGEAFRLYKSCSG